MLYIFQENSILLLSTIISTFFFLLHVFYKNSYISFILSFNSQKMYNLFQKPLSLLLFIYQEKSPKFILLILFFMLIFALTAFIILTKLLSFTIAILIFLPLSIFIALIIYYTLWISVLLLSKIIDVRNSQLNTLFSIIIIQLFLIYCGFPTNTNYTVQTIAFYLSIFDLSICYLILANILKYILKDILSHSNIFNHSNLWKVALTIIIHFLTILTLYCYIGNLYFDNAYSQSNLTIFDLFYYVVITFGTVGYGDISPNCIYTKIIAILIIFTSISCISIMLSSFLSVSSKK